MKAMWVWFLKAMTSRLILCIYLNVRIYIFECIFLRSTHSLIFSDIHSRAMLLRTSFVSGTRLYLICLYKENPQEFPGSPWLGLCASTARNTSSIPDQGTKIPKATWCGQKKRNKREGTPHKFIIYFLFWQLETDGSIYIYIYIYIYI